MLAAVVLSATFFAVVSFFIVCLDLIGKLDVCFGTSFVLVKLFSFGVPLAVVCVFFGESFAVTFGDACVVSFVCLLFRRLVLLPFPSTVALSFAFLLRLGGRTSGVCLVSAPVFLLFPSSLSGFVCASDFRLFAGCVSTGSLLLESKLFDFLFCVAFDVGTADALDFG